MFLFNSNNDLQRKSEKLKFMNCALYGDYTAFSTASGTIHIFSLSDPSVHSIISIPSAILPASVMEFSPNGKSLAVCDENGVHIIDHPLKTPDYSFTVPIKDKKPTALVWTQDRANKVSLNPFLMVGDEDGQVFSIKFQSSELIRKYQARIVSIKQIKDQFIVSTAKGSFIMSETDSIQIGKKSPSGDFDSVFLGSLNAICVARPNGKLSVASTDGKIKASLQFKLDYTLGSLLFLDPYLVSFTNGHNAVVMDMKTASILESYPKYSDFVAISQHKNRILVLGKKYIDLFVVYSSKPEFINALIKECEFVKVQKIAMEDSITDPLLLEQMGDAMTPEFDEYRSKISLRKEPIDLSLFDKELYDGIVESDSPTDDQMRKLTDNMEFIKLDERVQEKITKYIIANPFKWVSFTNNFDPDKVVEAIYNKEEYASVLMSISKLGVGELSRFFASIDTLILDDLVANSPPVRVFHVRKEWRDEFVKQIEPQNFLEEPNSNKKLQERLNTEGFSHVAPSLNMDKLTDAEIAMLIDAKLGELELNESLDSLRRTVKNYIICKPHTDIPSWITKAIDDEDKELVVSQELPSPHEHWGVSPDMKKCPVCGMDIILPENRASVVVFPCSHTYHFNCLRTKYCPICFSSNFNL